ncbi:hypothetical protein OAH87_03915 [Marinomonas sp.]|nr:hypothetical protein [Marinomonas sp.]MDB4837594.1 hypothetical protein [Marinomonas sp.]
MNLFEILRTHTVPQITHNKVPDWMMGCFKRKSISFFNGETDIDTRVFWLQTCSLTIDLRLPLPQDQASQHKHQGYLSKVHYEGWYAHAKWEHEQLSWNGGDSHQRHNKWPEPAILKRIGNCMIEFAPSDAYVEDWRLLSVEQSPVIGLELVKEINLSTGQTQFKKGALIVCGDYAGLVINASKQPKENNLALAVDNAIDEDEIKELLNFQTSVAVKDEDGHFIIQHSLDLEKVNQKIMDFDKFEFEKETNHLIYKFKNDNEEIHQYFKLETYIPDFRFSSKTTPSSDAIAWFEKENATLTRYTQVY